MSINPVMDYRHEVCRFPCRFVALAAASFFFFRDSPPSPLHQDKTEQHKSNTLSMQPVAEINSPATIPATPASQATAQADIAKSTLSAADTDDRAADLDAEPVELRTTVLSRRNK